MSTLVVEVCRVSEIKPHPKADRLCIASVKGWQVVIGYNPLIQKADFEIGDLCVYFPPDSVLPAKLAYSPHKVCKNRDCKSFNKIPGSGDVFHIVPYKGADPICAYCNTDVEYRDGTPGRTGVMAYCAELPKDEVTGIRPAGGRVRAARLRGIQSFGFIMSIDPSKGDNPDWIEGTDVKEHFGVTKWEPPIDSEEGDTEVPHSRFHRYTDMEHFQNFPDAVPEGTDVVISEKIHGKNTRIGLVLDVGEDGKAEWTFMAGSHDTRRKEWANIYKRFNDEELVSAKIFPEHHVVEIGQIFKLGEFNWKIIELRPRTKESEEDGERTVMYFKAEAVKEDGQAVYRRSDFWTILTPELKSLLEDIRDNLPTEETKNSIVVFGEMFGSGVQDLNYGLKNGKKEFRVFDIAINFKYVDYETVKQMCEKHNVSMVPILYNGPFSHKKVLELTDGPTTIGDPKDIASKFKGREGVVVKAVNEKLHEHMMGTSTNGRLILKSVSADYHERKGATDSH